jgi:hypothetical protein
MEHLEIPSNAYRAIKVPFLGEMYDPGIADFNEYPTKKGWDLENDRKAMENYRHLGDTYRDVGMQHAVEFLEDLLHDPSGMTGEEQDILRYGISMLRELLAISEARNTSLNTGANILNKAIEQARTPPETQLDLVECLRKRRPLDLLAVFTNDKFAKDKTSFAASRRRGVAFLIDCEKYQWHPWMLANEKDQVLWEVRQAFCHLQSWLFFGYIHQAFRILGVPVTQSDFLDPSRKYVSTHKLKTYLARAQKSRSRPAEAELAGLLTDALFILTKYRDHSELGDPMTTRSDGWFIRLLFLSSELNISILALAEEFKMLLRDSIIKPTTGDSIWPTSRTHDGIVMRRFFSQLGGVRIWQHVSCGRTRSRPHTTCICLSHHHHTFTTVTV